MPTDDNQTDNVVPFHSFVRKRWLRVFQRWVFDAKRKSGTPIEDRLWRQLLWSLPSLAANLLFQQAVIRRLTDLLTIKNHHEVRPDFAACLEETNPAASGEEHSIKGGPQTLHVGHAEVVSNWSSGRIASVSRQLLRYLLAFVLEHPTVERVDQYVAVSSGERPPDTINVSPKGFRNQLTARCIYLPDADPDLLSPADAETFLGHVYPLMVDRGKTPNRVASAVLKCYDEKKRDIREERVELLGDVGLLDARVQRMVRSYLMHMKWEEQAMDDTSVDQGGDGSTPQGMDRQAPSMPYDPKEYTARAAEIAQVLEEIFSLASRPVPRSVLERAAFVGYVERRAPEHIKHLRIAYQDQGREQGRKQGLERGLERGREQGREQGREEGSRSTQVEGLLAILTTRGISWPTSLQAELADLPVNELPTWQVAMTVKSLDEFRIRAGLPPDTNSG